MKGMARASVWYGAICQTPFLPVKRRPCKDGTCEQARARGQKIVNIDSWRHITVEARQKQQKIREIRRRQTRAR